MISALEHTAFNAIGAGVFVLDRDYVVCAWNDCLSRWTGLEANALLGTDIRLWFPHLRSNDFGDALRAVWQTPEQIELEGFPHLIPCYVKSGVLRFQRVFATLYAPAADGASYALFTLHDVTEPTLELEEFKTSLVEIEELWRNDEEIRILNEELEKRVEERLVELDRVNRELAKEVTIRKQAEEAFRHSEQLLSYIFENAAIGLALLHENGRYIRLNQTFCQMFGFQPEELLGKHFASLYGEEERVAATERWNDIVHGEERVLRGERRFQLRDGSEIIIYFTTVRFQITDGERRVITTGTDITDIKRAQEEIRLALAREQELNKQKANFVTAVSHEFRTPLTVILSSSEILQHSPAMPPEKRDKMHNQIERSVRRMTELLDEVVFIERSMRERSLAFPKPVRLKAMLEDVVAEWRLFDNNAHDIALDAPDFDAPEATAQLDESLARTIVSHLLSNALKFSPAGSTVRLSAAKRGEATEIRCADDGFGIPEADAPFIYDLFFRASNAGSRQGAGMGLAIVKRCVEAHWGTITYEQSSSDGSLNGSVFTVILAPSPKENERENEE
jgi:PAS domain S-box-containing protein